MPEVTYPDVHVHLSTGQDGNAFMLIGAVSKEIRRHVGKDAADQFAREAMNSESYDDLLRLIQSTANVS